MAVRRPRRALAVPALSALCALLLPGGAFANRLPAPGAAKPPAAVAERLEALSRMRTSGGYLASVTAAARCSVAAAAGRKVDCSTAVAGTRAIPVILATFENTGTPYSKTILREQLFGSWPTGTMTDYYEEVSYGALHVTGETYGWYSLPHPDAYYEGPAMCNGICEPEGKAAQFALDALAAADPDIDFRLYDNDGPDGMPDSGDDDGMVDFAALVHPETGGECENNNLWSHQVNFSDLEIPPYETGETGASGRKIVVDRYVLQPILSCDESKMIEIGVFCHEFGHAFGLPDLYDIATFDPGVGVWSLMAAGGFGGDLDSPETPTHMDAWSKKRLGWLKPTKVLVNTQGVTLAQAETSAEAVELYWGAPVRSAEHFLIENRQPVGFDERLPRGGLLIYQVDDDRADEGNYAPCIDQPDDHCDNGHYGVALEQADGAFELEEGVSAGDGNDPFRPETQTEFSLCTSPWSGDVNRIAPRAIKVSRISGSGPQMTFDVSFEDSWRKIRDVPGDFYGRFVARAGDVNGDGSPDYAVGAPGSSYAMLISGADDEILNVYFGDGTLDRFGGSIASGDVTGDNIPDLVIGAFEGVCEDFSFGCGRAYVFSGADYSLVKTFIGEATGDALGNSVAVVGDANGDGTDDILIGAPNADIDSGEGRVAAGRAYLYAGGSFASIHVWDGAQDAERFGETVSAAGDLNGDETPDIAIGAVGYPAVDGVGQQRGKVYAYSGASPAQLLIAPEGEFAGDRFGESIAPAGDIQDNGGADLAVGAPGYDGGTGRVYVLKGEDGVPFRTFDGDEYGDGFGRSLFGGLNITGGRESAGYEAELLIGAPQYFTSRRGKVYVYTPRFTLGDQAGRLAVLTGESADARIGLSVAAIGDLDCDMRSEIVVGGQGYAALHRGGGREPITAKDALQDILDGVDPEGEDVGAIVEKLRETAGL